MFKVTLAFLLFGMLVATAHGNNVCCPDTQKSLDGLKSDVENLRKFIEDLYKKLEKEFNWSPYPNVHCLPGFTYLPSTKSCYKVVYESHDWTSAGKKCQELGRGSHLVAITSEAENSALKKFLASDLSNNTGSTACVAKEWSDLGSFFWTCGQRKIVNNCKSSFVWKLSSVEQPPFNYTNWLPGEPSCRSGSSNEVCTHLWAKKDFGWNDIPCTVKICPVCQYTPK